MSVLSDIDDATSDALGILLRPIRSLLRKGLRAVAGWARNIFGVVGDAWDDLVSDTWHELHGLYSFGAAVYHALGWLITVKLPQLTHWAAVEVTHLAADVEHVAVEAAEGVEHAVVKAEHELASGLSWVERDLVAPVAHALGSAEHYLAHEVAPVVDLVTHPDKLLRHLEDATLSAVPVLAEELAPPAFTWLRRQGVHDIVAVATELEHVLAAVA